MGRIVFTGLLVIVASLAWMYHESEDRKSQSSGEFAVPIPSFFFEDASLSRFAASGALESKFFGKSMTSYGDETRCTGPAIQLIRKTGEPVSISSDLAVLKPNDIVELYGNVVLVTPSPNTSGNINFASDFAVADLKKKMINTERPVTTTSKTTVGHSNGVTYFYDEDRIDLLSDVKIRYNQL